jgi:hypothetical protein
VGLRIEPHLGLMARFRFLSKRFCHCGAPSLMSGPACKFSRSRSAIHINFIQNFTCIHYIQFVPCQEPQSLSKPIYIMFSLFSSKPLPHELSQTDDPCLLRQRCPATVPVLAFYRLTAELPSLQSHAQVGSSLYPEDGGDTFLRSVGSHKIYTAPHPRIRHSS